MTFSALQVLTAAQLNDFNPNTITTVGNVTVGGNLTVTGTITGSISAAGSDGQVQYNNGGVFGGASALHYDDVNSRVGIGITSPQAPLSFANTTGNKIDLYHNTAGSGDRYGLQVQSSELRIHSGAGGIGTGGITFGKNTTTAFTEHMRVTNDGNVGIGTSTPDYLLELEATTPILNVKGADTSYAEIRAVGTSQGTGAVYVGQSNTFGGGIFYNGDGSPSYATGETADHISFFRRNNGTNEVAFSYAYNTGHVSFRNNVSIAGSVTFPSGSISSTGYLTFDRGFCTNDFEVSGTFTTNYIRNDNGNFLALEGGDGWNLGGNASGEYVWLAAEGGVVIVSSDANSTVWANRNQIRITPEGGIDQRLKIHGGLETGGPDGGGVIRTWQAGSTYIMFGTAGMASQEYAVLTDGINTFIGAGSGGTTHIRGPNNDSSPQITNNGTNVSITGTCLFTDIDISGTARANEYRADDYGPADDCSFTFISDEDTGVYRVTTNQLGLAAGGSAGIVVASGTCITAAPSTGTTSGYQYVLRNNTFGTLYRFTSTIDVKEQVADFEDAGSLIDALRPVTFIPKFIAGQPTPDDQIDEFDPTVETEAQRIMREADLQYGFIAEEVAQAGDGKLAQYEWTDDGQLKATGWKWPDLIAVLTAEVKSLRARVATLESAT